MTRPLDRRSFLAAGLGAGATGMAAQSRKAPSFETQTLIGRRLRLEDYRGKFLFLAFWATWCPHCRRYLAAMDNLHAEFEPRKVSMLALSVDAEGWKVVAPYVRDNKLTVPIGLASPATQRVYDTSQGIPATMIIDPQGLAVRQFVGAPTIEQLRQLVEVVAAKA